MSRFHSYLNSSKQILSAYKGTEPFASFLKKHFASNKKFGSKDRKQISHLCYCYFRLGKTFTGLSVEERILTALFFCSSETNEILENLKPEWNKNVHLNIGEKAALISDIFQENNLFPFASSLSKSIDERAFLLSHLVQPDLFLRIRPGNKEKVLKKFKALNYPFQLLNETCLSLPNSAKVEDVIVLNQEAVVQDYSSQKIGEFISTIKAAATDNKFSVWDCCAASGGKSILAYDLIPDIQLTVSDIRESILVNLKKRFQEAGIKNYRSFVADLSKSLNQSENKIQQADLIIADVPCSGSGTWGRTPEQLQFFKESKMEEYVSLQKKITSNIIPFLKEEGVLFYITCSVFKKENEDVVLYLQEKFPLQLVEMQVLKGYEQKADTMFVAILKRK